VRFHSLRSFKENAAVLGKKVEGNAFVITDWLSESRAGGRAMICMVPSEALFSPSLSPARGESFARKLPRRNIRWEGCSGGYALATLIFVFLASQ
jgi:hypothetical protein